MRPQDIREMSDEEIRAKIEELYRELFNLRFQKAIGQAKNTARFKEVRRDIARLKTILRERELGIYPSKEG